MRERKSQLTKSDEVIQGLFENSNDPMSGQFLRWKLWKKWPEFVGPTIAAVSEPVGFQNGRLDVWVKNSSWLQQMLFLREQMKESLNEKLGGAKIRTIRLTLQRNMVPTDEETRAEFKSIIGKISKD